MCFGKDVVEFFAVTTLAIASSSLINGRIAFAIVAIVMSAHNFDVEFDVTFSHWWEVKNIFRRKGFVWVFYFISLLLLPRKRWDKDMTKFVYEAASLLSVSRMMGSSL
jgi:hypothetical protein